MPRTTVISVRGRDREELRADPNFVYVGRSVRQWWADSIWGNPYPASRFGECTMIYYGRALDYAARWHPDQWQFEKLPACHLVKREALERFREGFLRIDELQGKTLGCWCGSWMPGQPMISCHAMLLAQFVDRKSVAA